MYLKITLSVSSKKGKQGTTPANFIIQRKIEKAQLLLITNDLPVKQTSYLVGFEDFSYFNRVFKKITGMTPNEYRRKSQIAIGS